MNSEFYGCVNHFPHKTDINAQMPGLTLEDKHNKGIAWLNASAWLHQIHISKQWQEKHLALVVCRSILNSWLLKLLLLTAFWVQSLTSGALPRCCVSTMRLISVSGWLLSWRRKRGRRRWTERVNYSKCNNKSTKARVEGTWSNASYQMNNWMIRLPCLISQVQHATKGVGDVV